MPPAGSDVRGPGWARPMLCGPGDQRPECVCVCVCVCVCLCMCVYGGVGGLE